jgi:hypothetical protein
MQTFEYGWCRMQKILVAAEPDWVDMVDQLGSRLGITTRSAVVQTAIDRLARELGIDPPKRILPSKYDPWISPAERERAKY